MDFHNSTDLDSNLLRQLFLRHTYPYRHDRLQVRVRYSRGADFSGTCYYTEGRVFINLGRHLKYPYRTGTHIAKSQSNERCWWRETFFLVVPGPVELVLFVYLHELYHYLVKRAGKDPRRKESRCDRFATRILVDNFNCRVIDRHGRPIDRSRWDFQDPHKLVAAAPREPLTLWDLAEQDQPRQIPVTIRGARTGRRCKS